MTGYAALALRRVLKTFENIMTSVLTMSESAPELHAGRVDPRVGSGRAGSENLQI